MIRRSPRSRSSIRPIASPPDRPAISARLDQLAGSGRGQNNFDLLRLIAATAVVFGHSFDLLKVGEPFPSLLGLSWGTFGVLIFFSISGFLVARSWDKEPRLGAFAAKRALRLMPGLIVAVLLSALVLGPLVTDLPLRVYFRDPTTKAYVLNNVTMQTNYALPGVFASNIYPGAVNGSLWTLPLEVKAYAIVAVVGLAGLLGRRRCWGMVAVAMLVVLATIHSTRPSLPGATHFVAGLEDIQMPPANVHLAKLGGFDPWAILMGAFVIGAALYAIRRWIPVRADLAVLVALGWSATAVAGGTAPEMAAMIAAPYLVLWFAYRTRDVIALPKRFGDYSYGIYVYAFPIQQTISHVLSPGSGWLMFAIAFPITFVVAVLSWHFIERPALNLKLRVTHAEPLPA